MREYVIVYSVAMSCWGIFSGTRMDGWWQPVCSRPTLEAALAKCADGIVTIALPRLRGAKKDEDGAE